MAWHSTRDWFSQSAARITERWCGVVALADAGTGAPDHLSVRLVGTASGFPVDCAGSLGSRVHGKHYYYHWRLYWRLSLTER